MAKRPNDNDTPVISSSKFLRAMLVVFVMVIYFFLVLKTLLL